MTDIIEFEGRIIAALDRVRVGVDKLSVTPEPVAPPRAVDTSELEAALVEERTANAQLEERVRAIRTRQKEKVKTLEALVAEQTKQLAAFEETSNKLRRLTEELRGSNQALREANAAALPNPHLINKAMLVELEVLRATRAAEMAETDSIMTALTPLLAESADA